jgi:UDP-N-acetylmuramoyl-tripeptide--D-alanyl-D-alanine ligase
VTSGAEERLEGLGDLAGVLREEMAATEGVAVAIVPASQPEVVDAARSRAGRVVAAGLDTGDLRAASWSVLPDGRGTLTLDEKQVLRLLRRAQSAKRYARARCRS